MLKKGWSIVNSQMVVIEEALVRNPSKKKRMAACIECGGEV